MKFKVGDWVRKTFLSTGGVKVYRIGEITDDGWARKTKGNAHTSYHTRGLFRSCRLEECLIDPK